MTIQRLRRVFRCNIGYDDMARITRWVPMILVLGKPGQLGNRLFLFANFIAFSAEHGTTIAYLGFDDFANDFDGPRRDIWSRHPPTHGFIPPTILRRICYSAAYRLARAGRALRLSTRSLRFLTLSDIWADAYDLEDPTFLELVSAKLLITDGWLFHYRSGLSKHKVTIRRFLRPRGELLQRSRALAERARQDGDVLVGVHVRRGDYDRFLEGKYLYEYDHYERWMKRLSEVLAPQTVSFLVASDEDLGGASLSRAGVHFATDSPVVDLYALAECDFLVGPPSTFSIWASYYGGVPLRMMTDPLATIELEDFKVVGSQMDFPDVAERHR